MTPSTLVEAAKAEADAVEAELATNSKPGEQGIATQEEEASGRWERQASQKELKTADEVYQNLKSNAHEMGAEAVIDALIQVVDVHPEFVTPHAWPGKSDEVLREAPLIQRIGSFLCRGCPKIEIHGRSVIFLWKNKKTWTKKGVQVRADAKSFGELAVFLSEGAKAAVIVNYTHFRFLNTRQKVASIYHALRSLDADGKAIAPQWAGHFDEIELFGTGTWQEDVSLAQSIERSQSRQLAFELSPLDTADETAH